MSEPALDVRGSWAAIRRRRALVASLGLVGICGGVAYGLVKPALPDAVSMVLLPPSATSSAGTPVRDTGTQIAIATSQPVLDEAGQSVSPPIGAAQLKPNVTVTALSPDVLSIRVKATDSRDAVRLANAVASDYIHFLATTATGISALSTQAAQLTRQLSALQSQISAATARLSSDGASSAAAQDSALLGELNRELTTTSQELGQVNSQIAEDGQSGQVNAGAIRILQRATTATPPSQFRLPLLGGIGLLAGLFLGAVVAISEGQRDHRLRRRDDLVATLGVPVLASVEAERCRTTADWLRLFERYRPSVVDVWALRRLLRGLPSGDGRPSGEVRMVSFAEDHAALAVGPQIATFAASIGVSTMLLPEEDPAVVSLRAACRTSHQPRSAQLLAFHSEDTEPAVADVDLLISVAAVGQSEPRLDGSARDTTLLAVSAGFATVDDLARLALAALDSGHPIEGIVVANPDPDDSTTGGVSDAAAPRRLPTQLGSSSRGRATVTGRTRPQPR